MAIQKIRARSSVTTSTMLEASGIESAKKPRETTLAASAAAVVAIVHAAPVCAESASSHSPATRP